MDHMLQESGRAWFLPRRKVIMVPQAFCCSPMNRAGCIVLSYGTRQPPLSSLASNTGTLMNNPLWLPSPAAVHGRDRLAAGPHKSSCCYLFPGLFLINQGALHCCSQAFLLYYHTSVSKWNRDSF